jgi:TRAP-type uncharacterized transport system fused permease subunit
MGKWAGFGLGGHGPGGAIGYFGDECKWDESPLLIAGAVFLLWPGLAPDLIGLVVVGALFIFQKRRHAAAEKSGSLPAA